LPSAILPVVTYLGPASAAVLTGSVVVETVFSVPGIGRYFVAGALNRDYTMVLGTVVSYSVLLLGLNLVVDLMTAYLDPRIHVP
jgi:oligopeptide transport system permease protein